MSSFGKSLEHKIPKRANTVFNTQDKYHNLFKYYNSNITKHHFQNTKKPNHFHCKFQTQTQTSTKSNHKTKAHQRYVALFDLNFAEKLMCSANILQLPSLLELVELQCSKIICAANVERIATIAERVNAIQLLNAAVRSKLKIEI